MTILIKCNVRLNTPTFLGSITLDLCSSVTTLRGVLSSIRTMAAKMVFGIVLISTFLFQAILAKPSPQFLLTQKQTSDALASANTNTMISGQYPAGIPAAIPALPAPLPAYPSPYPYPVYPSYPTYPQVYPYGGNIVGSSYSNAAAQAQASSSSNSDIAGLGGMLPLAY